ncbi:hypothetical protein PHMEG_0005754 [Phytophthora megakarya]|uniref:Crinkler (CRN) n=1 Tax=Phytophthora megakarya TaxID=4795 RepID=A0A225WS69_9STRA|nr:hypothetical protein PHMEG_0005754 [Phytophthora megakarya]
MFEAKATKELEAKFEVKNSDEHEANEQTEKFPQELPMEHSCRLPRYFVRSCYPEYYDLILNKLEEFQIVTVTVTPGIGKSVFYGYFFERCKSGKTIIAASFSIYSVLKKVVVFRDGIQITEAGPLSYNFIEEQREAALQRKETLLILYDGPPQFEPDYPSKMVCFISPNEDWLKMMYKKEEACELYMPVWKLGELLDAAKCLHLGDEVLQKIATRFFVYGGVARNCLSTCESYVSEMIKWLEYDINNIDSLNELQRLLDGTLGRHMIHRICHYQPTIGNANFSGVRIASKFVARYVLEKLPARQKEERNILIQHFQGIPNDAAVCRGLFEMKVYVKLVHGVQFETQCISEKSGSDSKNVVFNCKKTSNGFVFFDEKDLSPRTLGTGPYHMRNQQRIY